jgi:hypothetical protein
MAILGSSPLDSSTHYIDSAGTFSLQSSVVHTTGFTGAQALRVNPTTTAIGYVSLGKISATDSVHREASGGSTPFGIGFWFRADTLPAANSEEILALNNSAGTRICSLRINSDGTLRVYGNNGTTAQGSVSSGAVPLSTWTHIYAEFGLGNPTGTASVRINGVVEISFSNGAFSGTLSNYDLFRIGKAINRNSNSVDFYYDDAYLADAYAGMLWIAGLRPDADGAIQQWSAGTGSSNFAEVADNTNATYVRSTAASQKAQFTFPSCASSGITGTIAYVCGESLFNRVAGVATQCRPILVSGATTVDSGLDGGSGVIDNFVVLRETDPDTSSAWTISGVDGVEVGAQEGAASGSRWSLYRVGLHVAYIPSVGGSAFARIAGERFALAGAGGLAG